VSYVYKKNSDDILHVQKKLVIKNFSTQFKVKKGINATSEKEGERN
jgi:hypothetical protein